MDTEKVSEVSEGRAPDVAEHPLMVFARWYLGTAGSWGFVPMHDFQESHGGLQAIRMYRQHRYQVEMLIAAPGYVVPEHTRDDVESLNYYIGGEIRFSLAGRWTQTDAQANAVCNEGAHKGLSLSRSLFCPAPAGVPYGLAFGPSGGVVLSIQLWADDATRSIASPEAGAPQGAHDPLAAATLETDEPQWSAPSGATARRH